MENKEYTINLAKHPVPPFYTRIVAFLKYLFIKPKFSKEALKPAEILVNHNKTITNKEKYKKAILKIPELELKLTIETTIEMPSLSFDSFLGRDLIEKLKEMGYITYIK